MTRRRVAIAVCAAALTACSSQPTQPSPSPTAAPPPRAAETTTPLLISALDTATRLFGSDGKTHLEYDLTMQNVFDAPVTVTSIEVLDAAGQSLMTMDEKKVAAFTRPVFSGSPTAVVPAGGVLATVMDVAVSPDKVPEVADPQDQLSARGLAECGAGGNPRRRRPGCGGRRSRPRHDRAAVTGQ